MAMTVRRCPQVVVVRMAASALPHEARLEQVFGFGPRQGVPTTASNKRIDKNHLTVDRGRCI